MSQDTKNAVNKFLFNWKNLTSLGVPSSSLGVILDNEKLYKVSPKRFNFYMQVLESITHPDTKILETVIKKENQSRFQREMITDKINNIMNYFNRGEFNKEEDVAKMKSKLASNLLTKDVDIAKTGGGNLIDDMKNRLFPGEVEEYSNNTYNSIIDKKEKSLGTLFDAVEDPAAIQDKKKKMDAAFAALDEKEKQQSADTSSEKEAYNQALAEYKARADKPDQVVSAYKNDAYYSPDNEKIAWSDRTIFIALTYIVRALALFLTEWAIFSGFIKNFMGAFALYFGMYTCIFFLIIFLTNARRDDMIFRMLFFYINTLSEDGRGVMRIVVHMICILMLIPIPYVVKEYREFNEPLVLSFADKTNILSGVEKFSMYSWILTSIIALNV